MFILKMKYLLPTLTLSLVGCSEGAKNEKIQPKQNNTDYKTSQQASTTSYQKPISNSNEYLLYKVNSNLIISVKGNEFKPYYNESNSLVNFIGQIPIDSKPQRNNKVDVSLAKDVTSINNMLEFILLLDNQPITKPYKQHFYQPQENSVFVRVTNISNVIPNIHNSNNLATPQQMFELRFKQFNAQSNSLFQQDNMTCFDTMHYLFCFGENDNRQKSQVFLTIDKPIFAKQKLRISAFNNSSNYGGIRIEWQYSADSIKDWKKIDKKIWEMLDELNVAEATKGTS